MSVSYEPIKAVQTTTGGSAFPVMKRAPEAASQTFKQGVPVALSSGNVVESSFGGSELVYGVAAEPGHNLSVAGTAQPAVSEGTPPNQPSASIIPPGAWVRDGNISVYLADSATIFTVMLKAGQTFSQSLVSSTRYALVKDGTTSFWYCDTTNSGTNDEHCVNIKGVDSTSPNTAADGARVLFQFAPATRLNG